MSLIFHSDNINDFLDFISMAKKNARKQQLCEAYELKNDYFLVIPGEDEMINHLVEEYGERTRNVSHEWLMEHGKNLGKVYLQ